MPVEQKAQLGKLVAELSDLIALRNGEMLSQYEREQLIENKRRRITSILAEQQQQRATLLEETRRSSGGKSGALDQSACKQGESVSQNEGLLSTAPLFLAFSENHRPVRPFGKRTYGAGVACPHPPTARGAARFSKRMFLADEHRRRVERTQQSAEGVEHFGMRECALRPNFELTRKGCLSNKFNTVQNKRESATAAGSTAVRLPAVPTASSRDACGATTARYPPVTATGRFHFSLPRPSTYHMKTREAVTYDNYVVETQPRHLPDKADRLRRFYGMV